EFALAYSPNNPRLLQELAASLDQLGQDEQAAGARAEASRLNSVVAPTPASQQAVITPVGVPRPASITVKLPEAHPLAAPEKKLAQAAAKAEPPARPASQAKIIAAPAPAVEFALAPTLVRPAPVPTAKAAAAIALAAPIVRAAVEQPHVVATAIRPAPVAQPMPI